MPAWGRPGLNSQPPLSLQPWQARLFFKTTFAMTSMTFLTRFDNSGWMGLPRPALAAALAMGLALPAASAWAQDAVSPAPTTTATTPDAAPSLSTNLGLYSQYRFRGIDQTWGAAALQGGVDWSHPDGWSLGAWASNVSAGLYPGGSLELDLYGGHTQRWSDELSTTVGLYGYVYPGANARKAAAGGPSQSYQTLEAYAGVTWRMFSYKLSVSTGDYFGANRQTGYAGGTRGTRYHDLSVDWTVDTGWKLQAHLGRTQVAARLGSVSADYTDWRVGVVRDLTSLCSGCSASLAVVGANRDDLFRLASAQTGEIRQANARRAVLGLSRNF